MWVCICISACPVISQLSLIYAISLQVKQLSKLLLLLLQKSTVGRRRASEFWTSAMPGRGLMLLNNSFRLYMELLNNNFKTDQQTRGMGVAKSSEPNLTYLQ